MRARLGVAAVLSVLTLTCRKPPPPEHPADAAPAPVTIAPALALPDGGTEYIRLGRPIGAAHAMSDVTVVAGFVTARRAITATAIGTGGKAVWTRDIITDVGWTPGATVTVMPAKGGVAVVFHGMQGDAEVTVAELVTDGGQLEGDPFPIGAASCVTDSELAWMQQAHDGSWSIERRSFGAAPPSTPLTLAEGRDPTLVCGTRRLFALGDGEVDVMLNLVVDDKLRPAQAVLRDSEFRGDDERGHELYAVGDILGIVRLGESGKVVTREVEGGRLPPWRTLRTRLTLADDVELVDGNQASAIVAFTREAGGDAGGAGALDAVLWERKGPREAEVEVAPNDPSHVRGPFFSGAVPGGVVLAWPERPAHAEEGAAAIDGLAYRVVSLEGAGEPKRIVRALDDVVDAGCDEARCYAVALLHHPGDDGGEPEAIEVLAYP
jgi:hypothetical protein